MVLVTKGKRIERKKGNETQRGKQQQQQKTRKTTERASSVRILKWQESREISPLFF